MGKVNRQTSYDSGLEVRHESNEKRRVRGICGQRRHRSDCACALSDQGLRCPLTEAPDTVGYINI